MPKYKKKLFAYVVSVDGRGDLLAVLVPRDFRHRVALSLATERDRVVLGHDHVFRMLDDHWR